REAVEDVYHEVKNQVKCMLYESYIDDILERVMNSDKKLNPFSTQDAITLKAVYRNCSVISHAVFKDNERTISTGQRVCGATTTLLMETEDEPIIFIMTWYWRRDDQQGFVEEFSLVQKK
ncbi:MAG: hypothetical protein ACKO96_38655, partial [Flammeovirgaceae bacterium]